MQVPSHTIAEWTVVIGNTGDKLILAELISWIYLGAYILLLFYFNSLDFYQTAIVLVVEFFTLFLTLYIRLLLCETDANLYSGDANYMRLEGPLKIVPWKIALLNK